ncbi:MAG TPA: hypothetical protein VKK79_25755 [Candidatus Lokiarchaeia archaeon]|nr:hypothetical protein [Candidatus Lokiarchaeia archaeon]
MMDSNKSKRLELVKISTTSLATPDVIVTLADERILQLDPPVTPANAQAWESLTNAFFAKQCDLLANVFYGRFGMLERLTINDPRAESEECLNNAEIQYLIYPAEPTPKWVFLWGFPMAD